MIGKKKVLLVCSPYYENITSNLIKGASGQAIQSFNLMCGFDIQTGLNL